MRRMENRRGVRYSPTMTYWSLNMMMTFMTFTRMAMADLLILKWDVLLSMRSLSFSSKYIQPFVLTN